MIKTKFMLTVVCVLLAVALQAQVYNAEKASAELKGKSFLGTYSSKSEDIASELNIRKKQIWYKIPLKNLTTGNARKDKKLLEALEAEQYPYAEFTGKFKGFDPKSENIQRVELKGKLHLHGKTEKIKVVATLTPVDENRVKFRADIPIYFTDFDVERPKGVFKEKDKHFIIVQGTYIKSSKAFSDVTVR